MYSIEIQLTEQELIIACQTGLMRYIESIKNNRKPNFSYNKNIDEMLLYDQQGCCGEMAFAKMMGVYFGHTINTFHTADVGRNIEVRFSNMPSCKVRPNDKDVYVACMSGSLKKGFNYHGYIYCEDAKKNEWSQDYNNKGRPAYFVPRDSLIQEHPPVDMFKEGDVVGVKHGQKPLEDVRNIRHNTDIINETALDISPLSVLEHQDWMDK